MKSADKLRASKLLSTGYNDHRLTGDWNGFRDLHIRPDRLLVFRLKGDELQPARVGTHADLFDE